MECIHVRKRSTLSLLVRGDRSDAKVTSALSRHPQNRVSLFSINTCIESADDQGLSREEAMDLPLMGVHVDRSFSTDLTAKLGRQIFRFNTFLYLCY